MFQWFDGDIGKLRMSGDVSRLSKANAKLILNQVAVSRYAWYTHERQGSRQ